MIAPDRTKKGERKIKWFKNLFCKNQKAPLEIPSMPSWNKIVEMMYDKCPDTFADEVTQVIYSQVRTMRCCIKNEKGLYNSTLERRSAGGSTSGM